MLDVRFIPSAKVDLVVSERRLLRELERREQEKKKGKEMPHFVYLHVQITVQQAHLLELYCQRRGLKKGEVVRRALDEFFVRERARGNI